MNSKSINPNVKKIILDEIFLFEYREVMRLLIEGKSRFEICDETGYSLRQIQRIIPRCWQEVCIRLAEKINESGD